MKRLFKFIKESCTINNNISSTRVISFIFVALISILVASVIVLSFLSMDIPNEIVIVLGSLKTTMLILLGVKQHYTSKDKISTTQKDKINTEK